MARVTVHQRVIESAWRRTDFGELWLLFIPSGKALVDLSAISSAADTANRACDTDGTTEATVGGSPISLPQGVAVYLSRTGNRDNARRWLVVFAESLERAGYSGDLRTARGARLPKWVENDLSRYELSVFIKYVTHSSTDREVSGRIPWAVAPEVAGRLIRTGHDWTFRRDDQSRFAAFGHFFLKLSQEGQVDDLLDRVQGAIPNNFSARLMSTKQREMRVRTSWYTVPALGSHSYAGSAVSWQDRLTDLLEPVRRDADLIEIAMVRPGPAVAASWRSMDVNGPPMSAPPGWFNKHVDHLRDTAPDAHGVQLLTGAHLERANDLSKWDIKELSPDRYLVTAQDLGPWFTTGLVDDATVNAAREDFGDMLRWRIDT